MYGNSAADKSSCMKGELAEHHLLRDDSGQARYVSPPHANKPTNGITSFF